MSNISPTAIISTTAIIHENVTIENNVVIHDYVIIYPNTILKNNVEIFDHCVIGKIPKAPGCISREIKSEFSPVIIDENTILSPHCTIYSAVNIGKNTLLGDNCSIREDCSVGDFCIISRNVSVNYNTKIGNRTKIMDNTHITGDAIIEDDVFISVLVATTNDNSMGRSDYDEARVKGPWIKRGSTIGAAANILPNVIIGENCIVGAGSVVTKTIPDNKVVMGVPAKIVRDVSTEEVKK